MKVREFRKLIEKGLGAAVVFIRDNPKDTKRYYHSILQACIKNNAYDSQCEGSRSQYLYEIIQLRNERDLLKEQVMAVLKYVNCLMKNGKCLVLFVV